MTTRQVQAVLYIILALCVLAMILSATLFDFIELDAALAWTMRYFALPILIVIAPSCCSIYLKFIQPHETKKYASKMKTGLRTVWRVFILTIGMTGIFIATTLSMIILTNAYLGDSRTINLDAKIIDSYTLTSKGRTKHYIKVQDQQLDRIIELQVQKPYPAGQTFRKTMQVGKWGLLYSRK